MISVIIPIASFPKELETSRKQLALESDVEVILVLEKFLENKLGPLLSAEKLVVSEIKGRGYSLFDGFKESKGEIILFLHADTILPKNWKGLVDKTIFSGAIGGAFNLKFNEPHWFLSILIFFSNLLFLLNKELWGDRAIFIQRKVLEACISSLNVPIMEDIRLSKCIRKRGKVVMLKEHVVTSADSFRSEGIFRHTLKIIKCRGLHALGVSTKKLYKYFYSEIDL